MDITIGTALWFAARGTTAPVLFSGLGADELGAGYARHRSAFRNGGWKQLESELCKDLDRLWYRNLGKKLEILL
jgi:asparagine synthetase B (glutamine-hydrolysing)